MLPGEEHGHWLAPEVLPGSMASSWWLLHTVLGRCVPPRQGTAGVHRWGPSTHRPLEPLHARRNLDWKTTKK